MRQNKFAEIRDEKLKKTEDELDNKLFRPARGKGHWLKSYARSKQMAIQFLEGGGTITGAGALKLRTPSFWDRPSWARGQSVWGEANARKRGEIDEKKSRNSRKRMKPPTEAPPPPPTFAGSGAAKGKGVKVKGSGEDLSSPTLYQSNLHQKLLEHGIPIPAGGMK